MKSYTDLKQSKKLAEFLSPESADMYYCYGMDINTKVWSFDETPTIIDKANVIDVGDIPCWSLAALMGILDRGALFKTPKGYTAQTYDEYKAITGNYHSNPVDSCFEMIIKLYEQKLL